MTDREWMDDAACVGTKLDLWFSTDFPEIREAKKVCASCPVINQCLAAALETNVTDDHGVLGGTTPRERHKIRRHDAGSGQKRATGTYS